MIAGPCFFGALEAPVVVPTGVASVFKYRGTSSSIQYLSQYATRNPGVVGLGGNLVFLSGFANNGITLSDANLTATVNNPTVGIDQAYLATNSITHSIDPLALALGNRAFEFYIQDIKNGCSIPKMELYVTYDGPDPGATGRYLIGSSVFTSATQIAIACDYAEVIGGVPVEPRFTVGPAFVPGDVVGVVYKLTNRSARYGCTIDIYKNGALQSHGAILWEKTTSNGHSQLDWKNAQFSFRW